MNGVYEAAEKMAAFLVTVVMFILALIFDPALWQPFFSIGGLFFGLMMSTLVLLFEIGGFLKLARSIFS